MFNTGWIYVISCDLYDTQNIKKIDFTEKIGLLEDEVRTSLLQRYSTTLLSLRILHLVNVSNPRKAEKYIFELLKQFRVEKEIFKVDNNIIDQNIHILKSIFPPEYSGITKETLDKLLSKLRKKDKKLAKDLQFYRHFSDFIYSNKAKLNPQNQQNISSFLNNMPNPCIVGTHFDWTKRSENQHIIQMRLNTVNFTFQNNNWDCTDSHLHFFLKSLISSV